MTIERTVQLVPLWRSNEADLIDVVRSPGEEIKYSILYDTGIIETVPESRIPWITAASVGYKKPEPAARDPRRGFLSNANPI